MNHTFRPWGMLPWILGKCPGLKWSLLASLSPEDRCLSTWLTLKKSTVLTANNKLLRIKDKESRFTPQTTRKVEERWKEFLAEGGERDSVVELDLFVAHADLVKTLDDFDSAAGENIVLDITSLPKRYFFPFIRRLVENSKARNIIATYAIPSSYTDQALAERFQEWRPLPMFAPAGEATYTKFVVSIGFMSMGLPDQVRQRCGQMDVELLFPFPPGPPGFHRNWEFVMDLQRELPNKLAIKHVDARDTSLAFDHLVIATDGGHKRAVLAPYGPKPHSLAMCLFAIRAGSEVCYTQPSIYHPDYSIGRSLCDGQPEVYAYVVRLHGHDIYTL